MSFGTFLILGKIKNSGRLFVFFFNMFTFRKIWNHSSISFFENDVCSSRYLANREKFFSSTGFYSEASLSVQVVSGTENSSLHFLLRQFGLVGGANLFTGCQVRVSAVVFMRRRMFLVKLSILRKVFVWNHVTS